RQPEPAGGPRRRWFGDERSEGRLWPHSELLAARRCVVRPTLACVPSADPVPPIVAKWASSSRLPDSTSPLCERAVWTSTERDLAGLHVRSLITGTMSPAGSGRSAPELMIGRRG